MKLTDIKDGNMLYYQVMKTILIDIMRVQEQLIQMGISNFDPKSKVYRHVQKPIQHLIKDQVIDKIYLQLNRLIKL
jgi:hypothetical protein